MGLPAVSPSRLRLPPAPPELQAPRRSDLENALGGPCAVSGPCARGVVEASVSSRRAGGKVERREGSPGRARTRSGPCWAEEAE